MNTNSSFRLFKRNTLLLALVLAFSAGAGNAALAQDELGFTYDYVCAGKSIHLGIIVSASDYYSMPEGAQVLLVDSNNNVIGGPAVVPNPGVYSSSTVYIDVTWPTGQQSMSIAAGLGDLDAGTDLDNYNYWTGDDLDWICLQIKPVTATAYLGCTTGTIPFSLTDDSFAGDDGVTWSISPVVTDGATIDSSGNVTIGTIANTYTIVATSVDDPSCPTAATLIVVAAGCTCSTPIPDSEWSGLHAAFPNLIRCHTCKTGDASSTYNCYAWCIGDTSRVYGLPDIDSNLDGYISATELTAFFSAHGATTYTIAYFGVNSLNVVHAALIAGGSSGNCASSSKIGAGLRMNHDLDELEGGVYGTIVGGY